MATGPSLQTVKRLFSVSGNRCAFPRCLNLLTVGGKVVGRIAHIRARSLGGPRHDLAQADDERHAFENLILLCPIHHDVVDADPDAYTVERMLKMKAAHESQATAGFSVSDDVAQSTIAADQVAVIRVANQHGGQVAQTINNFYADAPVPGGSVSDPVGRVGAGREIETLLRDLGSSRPLAECLAAGLSLARSLSNTLLESFCRCELAGYTGTLDKTSPDFPKHRMVEVFFSGTHTINPGFVGFGGSASVALHQIANDPAFQSMSYFWRDTVATLEQRAAQHHGRSSLLLHWTRSYSEMVASPKPDVPPDHKIQFYARPDTDSVVLQNIRAEFVKRLLALLPSASGSTG